MKKSKDTKDMAAIVIERVKGSELPASWLNKIHETPDKIFNVIIEPVEENRVSRSRLLMKWRKHRKKVGSIRPLTREEIYTR